MSTLVYVQSAPGKGLKLQAGRHEVFLEVGEIRALS